MPSENHTSPIARSQKTPSQIASFRDPDVAFPAKSITAKKWKNEAASGVQTFFTDNYCAWAVSQGYTAPGNPQNWSVRAGKLYLNYNDKVQADWLKDPDGFIQKADANWPAVLDN